MALATSLVLAEAARVVGADDGVRSVELVGQRLADVVHERRAARQLEIEPQLVGHHAAQVSRLDGVLPLVLRVAGAVVEPADQLDDLRVRGRDLEHREGAAAEIVQLGVERRRRSPRAALVDRRRIARRSRLALQPRQSRAARPRDPRRRVPRGGRCRACSESVSVTPATLSIARRLASSRPTIAAPASPGRQRQDRVQSLGQVVAGEPPHGDPHDPLGALDGLVGGRLGGGALGPRRRPSAPPRPRRSRSAFTRLRHGLGRRALERRTRLAIERRCPRRAPAPSPPRGRRSARAPPSSRSFPAVRSASRCPRSASPTPRAAAGAPRAPPRGSAWPPPTSRPRPAPPRAR